jgi:hypothetical protein
MRRPVLILAAVSTTLSLPGLVGPASAQAPAPPHLRGQVVSVSAAAVAVKGRDGKTQSIALTPSWSVTLVRPVDAGAILPGEFIGVTEVEKPGGAARVLEAHIFPHDVRVGEGRHDWDLKPHSKMTDGTVSKAAAGPKGQALDITYPGGSSHVLVPGNVPVVQMGPGDRTMIKPGAHVFILIGQAPSGGPIANMLVTGVGGAAPPM